MDLEWRYIALVIIIVSAVAIAYAIRYWRETGKLFGLIKFVMIAALVIYPASSQDLDIDLDVDDFAAMAEDPKPIPVPNNIPQAAATIQDAIDDLTWRAGVVAFLGNNTTLNETGLFYA